MATSGYDGTISINTTIQTGDINAQFDEMSNDLRNASEKLFNGLQEGAKKGEQAVATSFSGTAEKVAEGMAGATVVAKKQMDVMKVAAKSTGSDLLLVAKNAGGAIGQMFKGITKALPMEIIAILFLIAVIKKVADAFMETFNIMGKIPMYAAAVNQLKGSFSALKAQFATLAAPLVNLFLPVLQKVVDWLLAAVNTVAQVIAKLAGQETYMVAIAESSGEYAGNMQEAEKAAKGQLAAFDRLNVIGNEVASTSGGGGGGGGGGVTWKEVPIDPNKTKWVDDIKKTFEDTKEWIGTHFATPVAETATKLWNGIKEGAGLAYVGITTGDWSGFKSWWDTDVATPVKNYAATTWTNIKEGAGLAWTGIKTGDWSGAAKWFEDHVLTPTLGYFKFNWEGAGGVKETINGILAPVKTEWNKVSGWFATNVLDPLAKKFGTTWTGEGGIASQIRMAWEYTKRDWEKAAQWFEDNVFGGIKKGWGLVIEAFTSGLQSGEVAIGKSLIAAVNTFAGSINTTFANIERTINNWIATVKSVLGFFANGLDYIDLPQIGLLDTGSPYFQDSPYPPGLANGAVVQPNAPFMAILGDNKMQRELVAPEDMIRRIVREETAGQGAQRITIDFGNSSLGALIQMLNPLIKQENNRIGPSMARPAGAS